MVRPWLPSTTDVVFGCDGHRTSRGNQGSLFSPCYTSGRPRRLFTPHTLSHAVAAVEVVLMHEAASYSQISNTSLSILWACYSTYHNMPPCAATRHSTLPHAAARRGTPLTPPTPRCTQRVVPMRAGSVWHAHTTAVCVQRCAPGVLASSRVGRGGGLCRCSAGPGRASPSPTSHQRLGALRRCRSVGIRAHMRTHAHLPDAC